MLSLKPTCWIFTREAFGGFRTRLQGVRCVRSLRLHPVHQVREDTGEWCHADAGADEQQHFELLQGKGQLSAQQCQGIGLQVAWRRLV